MLAGCKLSIVYVAFTDTTSLASFVWKGFFDVQQTEGGQLEKTVPQHDGLVG